MNVYVYILGIRTAYAELEGCSVAALPACNAEVLYQYKCIYLSYIYIYTCIYMYIHIVSYMRVIRTARAYVV